MKRRERFRKEGHSIDRAKINVLTDKHPGRASTSYHDDAGRIVHHQDRFTAKTAQTAQVRLKHARRNRVPVAITDESIDSVTMKRTGNSPSSFFGASNTCRGCPKDSVGQFPTLITPMRANVSRYAATASSGMGP